MTIAIVSIGVVCVRECFGGVSVSMCGYVSVCVCVCEKVPRTERAADYRVECTYYMVVVVVAVAVLADAACVRGVARRGSVPLSCGPRAPAAGHRNYSHLPIDMYK